MALMEQDLRVVELLGFERITRHFSVFPMLRKFISSGVTARREAKLRPVCPLKKQRGFS